MLDKNGQVVHVGDYVRAIPIGLDVEKIILVQLVTAIEQRMDVEVLAPDDPAVESKIAAGFEGGGGEFGGGGASGQW